MKNRSRPVTIMLYGQQYDVAPTTVLTIWVENNISQGWRWRCISLQLYSTAFVSDVLMALFRITPTTPRPRSAAHRIYTANILAWTAAKPTSAAAEDRDDLPPVLGRPEPIAGRFWLGAAAWHVLDELPEDRVVHELVKNRASFFISTRQNFRLRLISLCQKIHSLSRVLKQYITSAPQSMNQ